MYEENWDRVSKKFNKIDDKRILMRTTTEKDKRLDYGTIFGEELQRAVLEEETGRNNDLECKIDVRMEA